MTKEEALKIFRALGVRDSALYALNDPNVHETQWLNKHPRIQKPLYEMLGLLGLDPCDSLESNLLIIQDELEGLEIRERQAALAAERGRQLAAKVEIKGSVVEVDLTTPKEERDPKRHSWSATNQFVDEPDTEVYYGNLHAQVSMFDIGLIVSFDPYEGNWKDGKWAREQAFEALKSSLTPEFCMKIFKSIIEASRKAGRNEFRVDLKKMLEKEL